MDSSCRESRSWTSFNYDKNVSLGLFWLERVKQPFLAAVWSQPGFCQADRQGDSGIFLACLGFMGKQVRGVA